mmetsp:Transcript_5675/g.21494  ORF Transcript_5675/g.21494 Transcript_5675/m.21494 type:complete len:418 (+) Transcript_5675:607-1860(+)
MALLTQASAPAAATAEECNVVKTELSSSRDRGAPRVVEASESCVSRKALAASSRSPSPSAVVAAAMRSKHASRVRVSRFISTPGSHRNASWNRLASSSGVRKGVVDGFSCGKEVSGGVSIASAPSGTSSKYIARSFFSISGGNAPQPPPRRRRESSAACSSSPTAVMATASASVAARSGAMRLTTEAPCALVAAAASSWLTRVASALDCVSRMLLLSVSPPAPDITPSLLSPPSPPARPASPPFARSASIICAKRYVAKLWQPAEVMAFTAAASFTSSSPALIKSRKWSARSWWKMEKYEAAAGPRALTSSWCPCCHACWIATCISKQLGCFSASVKSTFLPRSEFKSSVSHVGRPLTASTFLGSNFLRISFSKKKVSSRRTLVRHLRSASATAPGVFPQDSCFVGVLSVRPTVVPP